MRIFVDVHETKSGIAEMLAELGASVERASLPAAITPSGRTQETLNLPFGVAEP